MASLSLVKKVILLMFIIVILVAIPLTVYVVQKQQELRSKAAAATILSFDPSSATANSSAPLIFKINVDPKRVNQLSFLKLSINYDPQFLKLAGAGSVCSNPQDSICPDKGNPNLQTVEGPTLGGNNVSISMSITAATAKISSPITVAYVAFAPLKTGSTKISFANDSQAFSVVSTDQPSENVLAVDSATGAISSLPTTIEIASTALLTPTPTPQPGAVTPGAANSPPVCDSLNVDRTPSGNVPFSLNFTANGRDANGTISKVSFNFGDGPMQDVTTGGSIGSSSVSVQTFHTYHNAGTFTASAILTDNDGATNSPTSCTQTVTVKTSTGAIVTGAPIVGGAPGATISAGTPAPTLIVGQILSPTPRVSPIAAPGPSETFLKIGAVGGILSIIGAILLFAL